MDEHPLCWLGFEEDVILTSCANGERFSIDFPMPCATLDADKLRCGSLQCRAGTTSGSVPQRRRWHRIACAAQCI